MLRSVKSSVTKIKSLNQTFQQVEKACFIGLLVLFTVVWLKLNAYEGNAFLFVAEFPVSNVKVFCLCR